MTEPEKLQAGLEYNFWSPDVCTNKKHALEGCRRLNNADFSDLTAVQEAIRALFGSVGVNPWVNPVFNCDNGKNIHVGHNFLANYNVTILDIAPVFIGDNVMIGPGTLISTVNHPLSPSRRRQHLAVAKPVTIGNDVWIGGNVTILPGITIGSGAVIAAGAVVTRNVPDNTIVAGVPAKVVRHIPPDETN